MNDQQQPTYPRLAMDAHERVHVLATHLEVHGPFHVALDPIEAQHMAVALRKTAELADLNAEAYNDAIERVEALEHALDLWQAMWGRWVGWAKTIGMLLAIGAMVALPTWFGW